MLKRFFILALFSLIVLSCDDDGPTSSGSLTSDVYVTVTQQATWGSYVPVEGASVFTVPKSVTGVTDRYGSVLLRNVPVGTYEIFAEINRVGSGKSVTRVEFDTLKTVNINIIPGIEIGFTPVVEVLAPQKPAQFYNGENIHFSIKVTDDDTPYGELTVTVKSDLDGILFESSPGSNSLVEFETDKLKSGCHNITVTAIDKQGYASSVAFALSTNAPGPIEIEKVEAKDGRVKIEWKKYAFNDFQKYEIYSTSNPAEAGRILASFSNIDVTEYVDSLPPITSEYYYYVKVINKSMSFRNSEIVRVVNPGGTIYFVNPAYVVHHPSEPVVYVADNSSLRIYKINYETETVSTFSSIPNTIYCFDIGDNGYGLELYIPSNSGHIQILDAVTLDLKTTISTGLSISSVVTNGHGYVVAGLRPSPWWENPVRAYSRTDGSLLAVTGDHEGDILRFVPGTDNVISITTSVSPIDMEHFAFTPEGALIAHSEDKYHGDYALSPTVFKISPNGEYVVTSSIGSVYSASAAMGYLGMLDSRGASFNDFEFTGSAKTIYASNSSAKKITLFRYPELTRKGELSTKGAPLFLCKSEAKLILISKTEGENTFMTIEKFDIDE